MSEKFLPYCLPWIGEEEIAEVVDSLRRGWLTTGPKVKRFEEDFRNYVGAEHAIAVSSCTAALHLALAVSGVGPGDEVIVPTLTFCSTANVVVQLGARPVLVDVEDSLLISVAAVERAITPRTAAIVPVHYGGQACDLDALLGLARGRGIAVIEDAAHAAGASYGGRRIGTHGDVAAFSFYATKNMTTGEGGMITTNRADLAARMRLLSLHGMSKDAWNRYAEAGSWFYEVMEPGYKYNMTDIQAALGLHQLPRLDGFIRRRREIARRYAECFASVPELGLPRELSGRDHSYHLYPVQLDLERLTIDRQGFIEALHHAGIGASVHFIPVHLHPYYRETGGYGPEAFPVAERIYQGLVSLPLYPRMTDADVAGVTLAVCRVVVAHRK